MAEVTSGSVVVLYQEFTKTFNNLSAAGTQVMKSYSLPANTYSKIRARATGYCFPNPNAQMDGAIYIANIGASQSNMIKTRSDPTGTNDIFEIPFTVEYSDVQKTASIIEVRIQWMAGRIYWQCHSLVVEGII